MLKMCQNWNWKYYLQHKTTALLGVWTDIERNLFKLISN